MSKEIIENIMVVITVVLIVVGISYVISLLMLNINAYKEEGKRQLIQELCTRQQYDFCETKKIIYTLKEDK